MRCIEIEIDFIIFIYYLTQRKTYTSFCRISLSLVQQNFSTSSLKMIWYICMRYIRSGEMITKALTWSNDDDDDEEEEEEEEERERE